MQLSVEELGAFFEKKAYCGAACILFFWWRLDKKTWHQKNNQAGRLSSFYCMAALKDKCNKYFRS
jgi:hypothetical protein